MLILQAVFLAVLITAGLTAIMGSIQKDADKADERQPGVKEK